MVIWWAVIYHPPTKHGYRLFVCFIGMVFTRDTNHRNKLYFLSPMAVSCRYLIGHRYPYSHQSRAAYMTDSVGQAGRHVNLGRAIVYRIPYPNTNLSSICCIIIPYRCCIGLLLCKLTLPECWHTKKWIYSYFSA